MANIVGIALVNVGLDGLKKKGASGTYPKLVQRSFYANSATVVVPFGAKFMRIRCLGPGGSITSPSTSSIVAGGGVYSRFTSGCLSGDFLTVTVGTYSGQTASQVVSSAGTTLVLAGPGGQASGTTNGLGGSTGSGDTVLAGGVGGQINFGTGLFYFGGEGGASNVFPDAQGQNGDLALNDSLNLGGPSVWVDSAAGTQLRSPSPGSGGVYWYNGGSSATFAGGDGMVAIEFFAADPR